MAQTVFLTGASSGIGRAAAERLARRGYEAWITARDVSRLPRHPLLHPLALDLERPGSIEQAWCAAVDQSGGLDFVVQNAGAGIFGAVEDVTAGEAARQWQILVAGPLQVLRLAAGHLRMRRAGVIVGVSSLATEMPLPFGAHYSAGKAAFSALLAGLAMELKPLRSARGRSPTRRYSHRVQRRHRAPPGLPARPTRRGSSRPGRKPSRSWNGRPARSWPRAPSSPALEHPRPVARCGSFFQAKLGSLGARLLPRGFLLESIRRYYHLDRVDREASR